MGAKVKTTNKDNNFFTKTISFGKNKMY